MPLNLSDGDFTPYLQYDAKSGRFYAKPEGATERKEIPPPTMAFDMGNIKTGWIKYPEDGGPPEHVWDGSPTDQAQKARRPPGDGWKRGFEVVVFSNIIIPSSKSPIALRTFSHNSFVVNSVMAGMFCEYENAAPSHPGQVPIFRCTGVRETKNAYGMVFEPVFELVAWVDEASKVPAFEAYRNSRQQVLPPPAPLRRMAAMAPAGYGARQHVIEQRSNYDLSSMKPIRDAADGLEEVVGEYPGTDIGATF